MSFIDEIKKSDLKQFWSKRSATTDEITAFENDFSVTLPETYKAFLLTFGCGIMGHTEFYGLGCPETGIPNVRFLINALKKRGQIFPANIIPISDADEGFYACILCESIKGFAIGTVVVCRPQATTAEAEETIQLLAKSFETFCLMEIESQKR